MKASPLPLRVRTAGLIAGWVAKGSLLSEKRSRPPQPTSSRRCLLKAIVCMWPLRNPRMRAFPLPPVQRTFFLGLVLQLSLPLFCMSVLLLPPVLPQRARVMIRNIRSLLPELHPHAELKLHEGLRLRLPRPPVLHPPAAPVLRILPPGR